jgi:hypothetical protein
VVFDPSGKYSRERRPNDSMNKPAKQSEEPKQFTEAQLHETRAWLLRPGRIAEEAKEEATQKAARRRKIETRRQNLEREAKRKGCTVARREEIGHELEDLKGIEEQECGSEPRKHPSCRRPSARELGFGTDAPSVGEILEAATIQQGLRSKKLHLMLAKLAEHNPKEWGGVAEREEQAVKREAKHNPRIERTRERIKYGEIKEVAGSKLSNVDRVIAEHYFKSQRLRKPLRELSAEKASVELLKLDVDISADSFDRALRRLALVG